MADVHLVSPVAAMVPYVKPEKEEISQDNILMRHNGLGVE